MEKKDPPITRRAFLRKAFGLTTAYVLAPLIPQSPFTQPAKVKEASFEEITLPSDLISKERLKKEYHTTIYNLSDIKLSLREKVLSSELLFSELASDPEGNGVNKSLDIFLIDGPSIHSSFLTDEQKEALGETIRPLLGQEQAIRQKRLNYYAGSKDLKTEEYQRQLAELEERSKKLPANIREDYKKVQLAELDENYRPFLKGPTEDDLKQPAEGLPGDYVPIGFFLKYKQGSTVRYGIFIAVREKPPRVYQSGIVSNINSRAVEARSLDFSQSYPSPDQFGILVDINKHNGKSAPPGQVIRHEFAHFVASHNDSPNTDEVARDIVKQAFEAKQNGNDSLYYIVLQTPQEVIIT